MNVKLLINSNTIKYKRRKRVWEDILDYFLKCPKKLKKLY